MIDEKLEEELLKIFEKRYRDYNTKVLIELGNVIKQIGDLIPKDAYRLGQQLKYNTTIKKLVKELSDITKLSQDDIYKVLKKVAKQNLGFAETYYKAKNLDVPIYEENKALQTLVKSVYKVAGKQLKNIAKSSGITLLDKNGKAVHLSIEKAYKEVVDRSIVAISQGKETYYQTMKSTMDQLAESGVKTISYDNVGKTYFGRTVKKAYAQRIDAAVRRNTLDAIRQVSNESQEIFGKEFGADGLEISVHEVPAPDHELVQGRQFSKEEYERLQESGFAKSYNGQSIDIRNKSGSFRPISTLNCYHYVFSIVLGVSKPLYSDTELKKILTEKNKKIEFEGRKYDKYQASQVQRKIETEIRKSKDEYILANVAGDEDLSLKQRQKINKLKRKYNELSTISGLPNRLKERAYVSNYSPKKKLGD